MDWGICQVEPYKRLKQCLSVKLVYFGLCNSMGVFCVLLFKEMVGAFSILSKKWIIHCRKHFILNLTAFLWTTENVNLLLILELKSWWFLVVTDILQWQPYSAYNVNKNCSSLNIWGCTKIYWYLNVVLPILHCHGVCIWEVCVKCNSKTVTATIMPCKQWIYCAGLPWPVELQAQKNKLAVPCTAEMGNKNAWLSLDTL